MLRRDALHAILYSYQNELLERVMLFASRGLGSVVVCPTGTGKTKTSVAVAVEFLHQRATGQEPIDPDNHWFGRPGPVVFLVCTVALVEQQALQFAEFVGESRVSRHSGGSGPAFPSVFDGSRDVVVSESSTFQNALAKRLITVDQIGLVIFDECHHAVASDRKASNHPYAQLLSSRIRPYQREQRAKGDKRPLLTLGLTASPGMGKDPAAKISDLQAAMAGGTGKAQVVVVHDNQRELEEKQSRSVEDCRVVPMTAGELKVQRVVKAAMEHLELAVSFDGGPLRHTMQYEGKVRNRMTSDRDYRRPSFLGFAALVSLSGALQVLEDLGTATCAEYLKEWPEVSDALKELERQDVVVDQQDKVILFYRSVVAQVLEIAAGDRDGPSKLNGLLVTLEGIDADMRQPQGGDSRALVFVYSRVSALYVILRIQRETERLPLLSRRVRELLGKGSRELKMKVSNLGPEDRELADRMASGHRERTQLERLQKLREGDVRLLVATSVAEEGIDVPKCDTVIRYDTTFGLVSHIQARGRARAKQSKFILIMREDDRKRYDAMMAAEREMWRAVSRIPQTSEGEGLVCPIWWYYPTFFFQCWWRSRAVLEQYDWLVADQEEGYVACLVVWAVPPGLRELFDGTKLRHSEYRAGEFNSESACMHTSVQPTAAAAVREAARATLRVIEEADPALGEHPFFLGEPCRPRRVIGCRGAHPHPSALTKCAQTYSDPWPFHITPERALRSLACFDVFESVDYAPEHGLMRCDVRLTAAAAKQLRTTDTVFSALVAAGSFTAGDEHGALNQVCLNILRSLGPRCLFQSFEECSMKDHAESRAEAARTRVKEVGEVYLGLQASAVRLKEVARPAAIPAAAAPRAVAAVDSVREPPRAPAGFDPASGAVLPVAVFMHRLQRGEVDERPPKAVNWRQELNQTSLPVRSGGRADCMPEAGMFRGVFKVPWDSDPLVSGLCGSKQAANEEVSRMAVLYGEEIERSGSRPDVDEASSFADFSTVVSSAVSRPSAAGSVSSVTGMSRLNELMQQKFQCDATAVQWEVELIVRGFAARCTYAGQTGEGTGSTKKIAKECAARELLPKLMAAPVAAAADPFAAADLVAAARSGAPSPAGSDAQGLQQLNELLAQRFPGVAPSTMQEWEVQGAGPAGFSAVVSVSLPGGCTLQGRGRDRAKQQARHNAAAMVCRSLDELQPRPRIDVDAWRRQTTYPGSQEGSFRDYSSRDGSSAPSAVGSSVSARAD
eukprot:TRINITY_DN5572_c0_g1_i1.p1 TRINITY_DN5572_c0_g1~~TRINITY_DN5572_c0_g1_i1.p1  ORF type:complete len:1243 (+),score=298.76 TRINITY_DN5572_c0_g1_i1:444-4172(+)